MELHRTAQTSSVSRSNLVNAYYVLRLGSVFRVIFMDASAAKSWVEAGWELRTPLDTNGEAQATLEAWKANLERAASLPSAHRPKG